MASLQSVSNDIMKNLASISGIPRFIGAALHSETLDRIFTEGKGEDDTGLGIYALKTIQIKKAEGKFTSNKVNLRHTGTLSNSWTWSATNDSVEFGFRAGSRTGDEGVVTNSELIPKLEKQYGDIFGLTSKEEKLIGDLTDDFINDLF
jgi:hypothetical protein